MSDTESDIMRQKARDFLLTNDYVFMQKEDYSRVKYKLAFRKVAKKILNAFGVLGLVKKIVGKALQYKPTSEAENWGHDVPNEVFYYQSFPMLGIKGARSTDYRIKEYGLSEILDKNTSVLDIGCNVGFLDMSIAEYAGSITGIEYSRTLAEIASQTAGILRLGNVRFINADFNEWHKNNPEKFGAVFSFAVHHWLGVKPDEYADIMSRIIAPRGFLLFESHNINIDIGQDFRIFADEFKVRGFSECRGGMIRDSEAHRRWGLFRKE